jgi:hypothetical protein
MDGGWVTIPFARVFLKCVLSLRFYLNVYILIGKYLLYSKKSASSVNISQSFLIAAAQIKKSVWEPCMPFLLHSFAAQFFVIRVFIIFYGVK